MQIRNCDAQLKNQPKQCPVTPTSTSAGTYDTSKAENAAASIMKSCASMTALRFRTHTYHLASVTDVGTIGRCIRNISVEIAFGGRRGKKWNGDDMRSRMEVVEGYEGVCV